ncbi:Chromo domain-containing protein [Meloidogyne graminicola]|uniref:Chromo domain-containing protein n=1 Tax=Meloidogyne graminicola TaxID=189291 RepID=A0A8S9ZWK7_9BILA|nr:Chromo domain-containing protein [Meloidogyne graminicola]
MAPRRGNKFLALPRPQKFQVDAIVNRRTLSNGKAEYLVKWNGYPESEKSWEPEENLDCMELVEKFATFYKRIEAAKPLGPIERITGSARINDQVII